MKTIAEKFSQKLESAVAQIIEASHDAAMAALEQVFDERKIQLQKSNFKNLGALETPKRTPPRPPEEIESLEKQFIQAVFDDPGQSMSVLAPRLQLRPSVLQTPIKRLKAKGRLRTTGQRQFVRYFPDGPSP